MTKPRWSSAEEMFWDHVVAGHGNCWIWTGNYRKNARPGADHGYMSWNGRFIYAHRLSWEIHNGPIPENLFVLHTCDVPRCVYPGHLYLGTQRDNVADRERRGRGTTPPSRRKLNSDQVREILSRLSAGENHCQIARDLPVSRSTVWNIAHGRSYREVARG